MYREIPFQVRRARLILGAKQETFAEMFNVDVSTVSRWERGRLRPNAKVLSRIRGIVHRSQSILSTDAVKASHVFKFVAWMGRLIQPVVMSQGVLDTLAKIDVTPEQINKGWWFDYSHSHPQYDISIIRALEIIQEDKGWLAGDIAYAEAHCYAIRQDFWTHFMTAPLPDNKTAIIEGVEASVGQDEGFWVRLVPLHKTVAT